MSNNLFYSDSKLNWDHQNQLRSLVDCGREEVLLLSSCSIRRVWDFTSPREGGFTGEALGEMIVLPTAYLVGSKSKGKLSRFGFSLVIEGFLCHLVMPKLPFSTRRKSGVLSPKNNMLHAPPQNIFEYHPLREVLMSAYSKHHVGNSRLR
jgi:hypothetical protein